MEVEYFPSSADYEAFVAERVEANVMASLGRDLRAMTRRSYLMQGVSYRAIVAWQAAHDMLPGQQQG